MNRERILKLANEFYLKLKEEAPEVVERITIRIKDDEEPSENVLELLNSDNIDKRELQNLDERILIEGCSIYIPGIGVVHFC